MERNNYIAVYGSLRYGMGNHRVLGGAEYVDTTVVYGFSMHSFGGFPVLIPADPEEEAVVELYRANDAEMDSVDMLEGFREGGGGFYDRTPVELDNGHVAWVYFIDDVDLFDLPDVPVNAYGAQDWIKYVEEAAA